MSQHEVGPVTGRGTQRFSACVFGLLKQMGSGAECAAVTGQKRAPSSPFKCAAW